MNVLEIYKELQEIYDNDVMLHAEYGNDIITDNMLDGEYKILRKFKRLLDDNIDKMAKEFE